MIDTSRFGAVEVSRDAKLKYTFTDHVFVTSGFDVTIWAVDLAEAERKLDGMYAQNTVTAKSPRPLIETLRDIE